MGERWGNFGTVSTPFQSWMVIEGIDHWFRERGLDPKDAVYSTKRVWGFDQKTGKAVRGFTIAGLIEKPLAEKHD